MLVFVISEKCKESIKTIKLFVKGWYYTPAIVIVIENDIYDGVIVYLSLHPHIIIILINKIQ